MTDNNDADCIRNHSPIIERLKRIEKTLYIDNGEKSMQTKIELIGESQERIEDQLKSFTTFFKKVALSVVTALIFAVVVQFVKWK